MGNSDSKGTSSIPILKTGKAYQSIEQVTAEGASEKKTLVVIHGQVYDLTKFLHDHPGGADVILQNVGKDGSTDFDNVGHSKTALNMMKEHIIGYIQSALEAQEAAAAATTPAQ